MFKTILLKKETCSLLDHFIPEIIFSLNSVSSLCQKNLNILDTEKEFERKKNKTKRNIV